MKKVTSILLVMALFFPLLVNAKSMMHRHHMEMKGMEKHESMGMGVISDDMKSCIGYWVGKGTMMDMKTGKDVPYAENVVIQPVLENKFLMIDSISQPDPTVYQGKGIETYLASHSKYVLNWFDSMGFGGKFMGTKQGNTITYMHKGHGPDLTLTIVMDSVNLRHMTLTSTEPGKKPVQMMAVTYNRYIPPTNYNYQTKPQASPAQPAKPAQPATTPLKPATH